jgi:hypothetical protein
VPPVSTVNDTIKRNDKITAEQNDGSFITDSNSASTCKKDEVTGGWRKLRNEELRNLYSSPSIIRMTKSRRMTWIGHVARMGEKRNVYRRLVGKPEGKKPLGRPRRSWVDNIKMDLRDV